MAATPDTVDCQDCGVVLMHLSPAQAAQMALRPYDYVHYCARCSADRNGSSEVVS